MENEDFEDPTNLKIEGSGDSNSNQIQTSAMSNR